MRVLVACEFSGVVREAFAARGHDAWSCDLLPSEIPGQHYQCDVEHLLDARHRWDLLIAHPPCTYLAASGLHWNKVRPWREKQTTQALTLIWALLSCGIPRICIENPVGVISTRIRKPDQIVQPWWFGDDASKATCLWLRGLPLLRPTSQLAGGRLTRRSNQLASGQSRVKGGRTRERSRTFPGMALAMAEQWGGT